jgi:hypothetical protein
MGGASFSFSHHHRPAVEMIANEACARLLKMMRPDSVKKTAAGVMTLPVSLNSCESVRVL